MNKAQQKQAEGRVNRIHRQCHECLKFINQHCKGKIISQQKRSKYFGTEQKIQKLSGLNFCDRYEYDERLYVFINKMPTFKSIKKEAVKKQVKKLRQKIAQEHTDLVDMAAGLNLKDFAHLIEK